MTDQKKPEAGADKNPDLAGGSGQLKLQESRQTCEFLATGPNNGLNAGES